VDQEEVPVPAAQPDVVQPDVVQPEAEPLPQRTAIASAAKKGAVSQCPRGSRLPDDWILPTDWGKWAMAERPDLSPPDIVFEAEKFADYWHAVAGNKANRVDWQATWRNWIRRAWATGRVKNNQYAGNGAQQSLVQQRKPQPLSFNERDRLDRLRFNKTLGFTMPDDYESLERRAAFYDEPKNIIDLSDLPQDDLNKGLIVQAEARSIDNA